MNMKWERKLGTGAFGDVMLARGDSGKYYAVKTIPKIKKQEHNIQREVLAGTKLQQHPNVVQFVARQEDEDYDYLVFDYARGCDLFSFMENRNFRTFTEVEARKVISQLVDALKHAHSQGIVHLDVKLDNIMINPSDGSVKLIDFGLCDFVTAENNGKFVRRCGSEEYCSPEVIMSQTAPYDGTKVDVWCLGVVLYTLLSATFPFDVQRRKAVLRLPGAVHPRASIHFECSASAKDLLLRMLDTDPDRRISMNEIAAHPWLRQK